MADPTTRADALLWIKRQLGDGKLCVELTDDQVGDAYDEAVRWYVGRRGIRSTFVIVVGTGTQEYDVPADCDMIVGVTWPGKNIETITALGMGYELLGTRAYPVTNRPFGSTGMFGSGLVQSLQSLEATRRILGGDPTWEYRADTRKLLVYPYRQVSGNAQVDYLVNTLSDAQLAKLPMRERDLVLRYAKECGRDLLGEVRGKYTEWASAGGPKGLNGTALKSEASERKKELTEELMNLTAGVPFLTG